MLTVLFCTLLDDTVEPSMSLELIVDLVTFDVVSVEEVMFDVRMVEFSAEDPLIFELFAVESVNVLF